MSIYYCVTDATHMLTLTKGEHTIRVAALGQDRDGVAEVMFTREKAARFAREILAWAEGPVSKASNGQEYRLDDAIDELQKFDAFLAEMKALGTPAHPATGVPRLYVVEIRNHNSSPRREVFEWAYTAADAVVQVAERRLMGAGDWLSSVRPAGTPDPREGT